MLPASTKAGGLCQAFPDVCKTPSPGGPVPVPYTNVAMLNQAVKTSTKVKFVGKAVVTRKSEVPMSSGDEAGTAGGVVSGVIMNKLTFKAGSSKVKVQGQPCIFQSVTTAHNGSNANQPAGTQVAPSQNKVLVAV